MISKYTKGMVYYIDLGNNYGVTVQQGRRPCIIVSNNLGNFFSENITVIPCTTNLKRENTQPTHLPIQVIPNVDSVALCENIVTVPKRKCEGFLGVLDNNTIDQLDKCLAIALGLTNKEDLEVKSTKLVKPVPVEEPTPKTTKRKIVRINPSEMEQFIKDCETKGTDYVMKKYQVASKIAVAQRKNYYKNKLKEVASK